MASGRGGLRDDQCSGQVSAYLSSTRTSCEDDDVEGQGGAGAGREEEDDFSLEELCRMSFADDQVDSDGGGVGGGGGGHWMTVDETFLRSTSISDPHRSFNETFQESERAEEVGGGARGRSHGRAEPRVGDVNNAGGADRSYVPLDAQDFWCFSVRDSSHDARFPPLFDEPAASQAGTGGGPAGNERQPAPYGPTPTPQFTLTLADQLSISCCGANNDSLVHQEDISHLGGISLLSEEEAIRANYLFLTDGDLPNRSFPGDTMSTSGSNQFRGVTPSAMTACQLNSPSGNESLASLLKGDCFVSGGDDLSTKLGSSGVNPGSRKVLKANRRRCANSKSTSPSSGGQSSLPNQLVDKSAQAEVSRYVVRCLTEFGFCVVDRYMGGERGSSILKDVQSLALKGVFRDGQLISPTSDSKSIRGDKIAWVERNTEGLGYIPGLMERLDGLVESLNGRIGPYRLRSRSKAMVACYPGRGRGYMRHVDNATQDGRCITCTYYLNKSWNAKTNGGMLRIFPSHLPGPVDVEPNFDRLLIFWSDHRNPHEVQPAFKDRYAITIWYFDSDERRRYLQHEMSECNSSNIR